MSCITASDPAEEVSGDGPRLFGQYRFGIYWPLVHLMGWRVAR
jgi:hypothetical protein